MDQWKLLCIWKSQERNSKNEAMLINTQNASAILWLPQYIHLLCPFNLFLHRSHLNDCLQNRCALTNPETNWILSKSKLAVPRFLRIYSGLDLCINPGDDPILQFDNDFQQRHLQAIYLLCINSPWIARFGRVYRLLSRYYTRIDKWRFM